MTRQRALWDDGEPTPAALSAIEREWPLLDAELAVVDAEVALLNAEGGGSALDWRRLRRAEQRVLRETTALAARPKRGRRPSQAVAS